MNIITIIGRPVDAPQLDTTTSGTVRGKFRMADTVYSFKAKKRVTQFVNVVAYGKKATLIADTFKKGSKIAVSGTLELVSYQKDGEQRIWPQLNMEKFEYCSLPAGTDTDTETEV